ncbi:MAG TPA: DUF433 domain-containing protein [Caldilineae bacterium]|nr:DUF433 domain-containing protein [Caldilineae bacterium]
MTILDITAQIDYLSTTEKAQILQWLVFDLTKTWPGIEKRPGVAGGSACIVRTRIPVWVLEGYRRLGWSEARILANFPTLRPADLTQAWAYVAAHPQEIELDIRENEEA